IAFRLSLPRLPRVRVGAVFTTRGSPLPFGSLSPGFTTKNESSYDHEHDSISFLLSLPRLLYHVLDNKNTSAVSIAFPLLLLPSLMLSPHLSHSPSLPFCSLSPPLPFFPVDTFRCSLPSPLPFGSLSPGFTDTRTKPLAQTKGLHCLSALSPPASRLHVGRRA